MGHSRAAAERYRRSDPERHEARRRRERGETFPDSPDMLAARATRLIQRNSVPVEAALEATRGDSLDRPRMHERIVGVAKDLQAWSFLPRGVRAARTVARISARERPRTPDRHRLPGVTAAAADQPPHVPRRRGRAAGDRGVRRAGHH
ncbi:hypothetical protein [Spongiactinospora gelatinilytica]|uniref:hypothetical protein n=1 Tax=Spongiactinospora gelatinilytica TaxID=2666298 RepID=UPI001F3A068F|nr:hypothetical protein [Spongiactinospora gelatinilytica]